MNILLLVLLGFVATRDISTSKLSLMVHSCANCPRPKLILEIHKMDIFKAPFLSLNGETQVETRLWDLELLQWNRHTNGR